jgi:hypothetical protein
MTKTNPHFLTDVNADWHACLVSNGGGGGDDDDGDSDDDNDDVDDGESQKGSVVA